MDPLYGCGLAAIVLIVSMYCTGRALDWSRRNAILDVPSARSSHTAPTPRGGGLGIVAAFAAGQLAIVLAGTVSSAIVGALACAYAVALVGYVDDLRSVSAAMRLSVQAAAAMIALTLLSPLPPLSIVGVPIPAGPGAVLYFLGLLWLTNLYNFMDGIDGLAASQAVAVCMIWMILAIPFSAIVLPLVLAAATAGFLHYNWPPARVFMGDVGSGFLGFALGVVSIAMAGTTETEIGLWLIPLAGFIGDATATLLVRIARGRRPDKPHRSHLYQRLSRRWNSHARVTLVYSGLVFLVFGPIAIAAATFDFPASNGLFVAVSLAVVALCIGSGAGRDD
jgi:Fuc2NAc and GlcNAc transferase